MSWTDVISLYSDTVTGLDNSGNGATGASVPVIGAAVDLEEIRGSCVIVATASGVTGSGGEIGGLGLQGSLDGANWYGLSGGGAILSAPGTVQAIVSGPARFVRVAFTVLTFSSSPGITATVSVVCAAQDS